MMMKGWSPITRRSPAKVSGGAPMRAISRSKRPSAATIAFLRGFDVGFRIRRLRLIVRRLGTSRVIVVAAPAYLAAAGRPDHPQEVIRHRLIGFAPVFWAREWRFQGPEGPVVVPVQPALLTHATASLRQAALDGFGLAALPDWAVARELADGRLQRVLSDWTTPEAGIYAVYPSNRLMATRVRACVDHLARHLAVALPAQP